MIHESPYDYPINYQTSQGQIHEEAIRVVISSYADNGLLSYRLYADKIIYGDKKLLAINPLVMQYKWDNNYNKYISTIITSETGVIDIDGEVIKFIGDVNVKTYGERNE